MTVLENEQLRIVISPLGGTLQSVRGRQTGIEYLWQGDEKYWKGQAPNLFPLIGRLFEKRYTLHGRSYDMTIHGFASTSEMEVEQETADSCVFLLRDSEATRAVYPYAFEYRIRYVLNSCRLLISYEVTNLSEETMHFGVGGHPGINVPLEPGLQFEDYDLTFCDAAEPNLISFSSDTVLVDGIRTPFPLKDSVTLPLRHDLFDRDAIVLADAARGVTLSSPRGQHGVRVTWPQMPYIGFWHMPRTDAPYVCIEPWSMLPGRDGVIEDLETMPDMTALEPGRTYVNTWAVEVW